MRGSVKPHMLEQEQALRDLRKELGDAVRPAVPLSTLTTLRIGGPADYFFEAKTVDAYCEAFTVGRQLGLPIFTLAGGSNLLVNDHGFRGLVIKNVCARVVVNETLIDAEAGVDLIDLCEIAYAHGLSGLEPLTGIRGSLGGAIYGNAGAFGRSISELIDSVELLSRLSGRRVVAPDYFEFVYRSSRLTHTDDVVVACRLKLVSGDRPSIRRQMNEILDLRRSKHPTVEPTAGSFFKNIKTPDAVTPAGRLLEQVGAKQMREGDAAVYHKHANIPINLGSATARQMLRLTRQMKARVKAQFDIALQEEVRYLGETGLTPYDALS